MGQIKRSLPLAVAASVLAMALGACGSGGGPGGPAGNSPEMPDKALTGSVKVDVNAEPTGTISVAVPSDAPGDVALRRKQAEAFMRKYPKVKVTVVTVPATGYDQKILTMIAGGKAPDVFGTGDVVIPTIVNKNYALDLKPLMQADGFDTSAYLPQVIDGLTYDGKIVGLTDNWDTQVMYYNRALFKRAGVAPPTNDWTWADYEAAAKKLTSGEGRDKVYGSQWGKWFVPVLDVVAAAGGTTYGTNNDRCGLTDPQSLAGLQFLDRLRAEGVDPGATEDGALAGRTPEQAFMAGKAAMFIGAGRWDAFEFAQAKNLDWAVAPLPKGPAGRSNFFHLAAFSIPSNSKNPNAAWKFLRFITSDEGVRMGLDNMQGVPALKSVATDPSVASNPLVSRHDALQPFLDSLPTARRAPQLTNFFRYQDKIDAAMQPLWKGKMSPQEAAQSACKAVNSLLGSN
jgi:multiple sugar transport system substrate-binding protein